MHLWISLCFLEANLPHEDPALREDLELWLQLCADVVEEAPLLQSETVFGIVSDDAVHLVTTAPLGLVAQRIAVFEAEGTVAAGPTPTWVGVTAHPVTGGVAAPQDADHGDSCHGREHEHSADLEPWLHDVSPGDLVVEHTAANGMDEDLEPWLHESAPGADRHDLSHVSHLGHHRMFAALELPTQRHICKEAIARMIADGTFGSTPEDAQLQVAFAQEATRSAIEVWHRRMLLRLADQSRAAQSDKDVRM